MHRNRCRPLAAVLTAIRAFVLVTTLCTLLTAQALVNGGAVSGVIPPSGGSVSHTFFANGGEGFQLRILDVNASSLYPTILVFDPTNVEIARRGGYDVAAISRTAPRTGTYRVEVRDGNVTPQSGPYRLQFTRAPGANEGGALPNGSAVNDTIDVGDLDSYTFAMAAGDAFELRLADLNATNLYPTMSLYDPSGTFVEIDGNYDVAAIRGVASYTGTYTVVVGDGNTEPSRTGAYRLHFVRVPGANSGGVLPNGGSIAASLDLGDLDTYTFAITAGENYLLRVADVNGTAMYPSVSVYDPAGRFVTMNGNYDVAAVDGLAYLTGTYTVVVEDGNTHPSGTGSYELHFVRAPGANAGGTLPNGGAIVDSIQLGELDSYTFAAAAGESFLIRVADTNSTALYPTIRVFDPYGTYVGGNGNYEVAAFGSVAVFAGTYTVVVSDGNTHPSQIGDYVIRFVRAPGAAATGVLRHTGTVGGTLPRGGLDSYAFELAAGQSFAIRVADTNVTGFYPRVLLYDPRGGLAWQDSSAAVAAIAGTAATNGTYTVVVADGNTQPAGSGAYDLHVARIVGANEHGFLLDGAAAHQDISLGDVDTYTFVARAGDLASITVTDTNAGPLYPTITLYDPRGARVTVVGNSTTAVLTRTIERDGTHTVLVADGNSSAGGTGAYSIVLTGAGTIGNSGCSNEGPPTLGGAPSAATGFAVLPATFSRTCAGPAFVILGPEVRIPVLLQAPLTCGTCGLSIANIVLSGAGQVAVPPLSPALVGLPLSAQSVCTTGSCLTLSAVLAFEIEA